MNRQLWVCAILFSFNSSVFGQVPPHPRILFGASDTASIGDRIESLNVAGQLYAEISQQADYYLTAYLYALTPPQTKDAYYTNILSLAFRYVIEHDDIYSERAKFLLFNDVQNTIQRGVIYDNRLENWIDPSNPSAGTHGYSRRILTLGLAYDWLYDVLSEYERGLIRNRIIDDLAATDDPLGPRVVLSAGNIEFQNKLQNACTALLVGAIAIYGEAETDGYGTQEADADIDLARTWGVTYDNSWINKTWSPEDGAYIHGISYAFWSGPTAPVMLEALGRWDNIDYFQQPNVKDRLEKFFQWVAFEVLSPPRSSPFSVFNNLNDSYNDVLGGMGLAITLAAKYPTQGGLSSWVFDNTIETIDRLLYGTSYSYMEDPKGNPLFFILPILSYQQSDPPTPVDPATLLPLSKLFRRNGLIYIRTSDNWATDDDIQFAFTDQPALDPLTGRFQVRHDQADKNHFTLSAYGDHYIIDQGYPCQRPEAHNYILVDGKGEAYFQWWERDGRIAEYTKSSEFEYIHGDATSSFAELYGLENDQVVIATQTNPVYADPDDFNPVQKAQRFVGFVRETDGVPAYLVMGDDIDKDGTNHSYSWLFHTQKSRTLTPPSARLFGASSGNYLDLFFTSASSNITMTSETFVCPPTAHHELMENYPNSEDPPPEATTVKVQSDPIANPYYHVALLPHDAGDIEPIVSNSPFTNGDQIQLTWPNGYTDVSIFKYDDDDQTTGNDYVTDAKLSVVRHITSNLAISSFLVAEGTLLLYNGGTVVDLGGSSGTVAKYGGKVDIVGKEVSSFKVYAPSATIVTLNDLAIPFIQNGDYVEPDVLGLASQGKTTSLQAMDFASQRKLVREPNGKIHQVFESGKKVFYRNSSNDGSSWNNLQQLSSPTYTALYPSITERGENLWAIWQIQGSQGTWGLKCKFSLDGGVSWSSGITLGQGITSAEPGPLAVVSAGDPAKSFELMMAYRDGSAGIKTRRTTSYPGQSGWSSPITVTGSSGNSSNPSLNYRGNDYGYFKSVWIDNGKIYYSPYYPDTWSPPTWVNDGTYGILTNEANPSFGLTGSNDIRIAWQATDNTGKDIIVENANLSNVYKTFEPSTTSNHYSLPSITGHDGNRLSVFWHDTNKKIRRAVYDPSTGWTGYNFGTNGFNVTTSIQNPSGGVENVIWLSGEESPFSMIMPAPAFNNPLANPFTNPEETSFAHGREIVLGLPSTSSYLKIGLSAIAVTTITRDTVRLATVPVVDTTTYSLEEVLSLLESSPSVIGGDADEISLAYSLNGSSLDRLVSTGNLVLETVDGNTGEVLSSPVSLDLTQIGRSPIIRDTISLDARGVRGRSLVLRMRMDSLAFQRSPIQAFVVERFIEAGESLSSIQGLTSNVTVAGSAQNYPNPFNPVTKISYEVPQSAHVTLTIYDILGRSVRTLVDEFVLAGQHEATFDGRGLASGVYFYRLDSGTTMIIKKMLLLK